MTEQKTGISEPDERRHRAKRTALVLLAVVLAIYGVYLWMYWPDR